MHPQVNELVVNCRIFACIWSVAKDAVNIHILTIKFIHPHVAKNVQKVECVQNLEK